MGDRFDGLKLVGDDTAYRNFDNAWREQEQDKLVIEVEEETYKLPITMPASLVLYQIRKGVELDVEDIPGWLEAIMGRESLDKIVANPNVTWDKLTELTLWLLRFYGVLSTEMLDGQEDGEEAVPKD